jgi:hypothetical protein
MQERESKEIAFLEIASHWEGHFTEMGTLLKRKDIPFDAPLRAQKFKRVAKSKKKKHNNKKNSSEKKRLSHLCKSKQITLVPQATITY